LDLLTRPTADCDDKDKLLKSVEDLNALKLRCQRSRYDELEKKHYWKSTPTSIAEESSKEERGVGKNGVDTNANLESLHHVAPGDDPLSALVQDKNPPNNSTANKGKSEDKKGKLFGGDGIFGGRQNRARSKSKESMLSDSLTSVRSPSDGEGEACAGSRWANFYSTREVLCVIEKDLDRLPSDHYKIYHEWRLKNKGWKQHREREEEWKRRQQEKEEAEENQRSSQSLDQAQAQLDDEISIQSQPVENLKQSWMGQSWSKSMKKRVKSLENLTTLLELVQDDEEEGENERRKQEESANAEIQISIKERAERISQILFVYARVHPEIGYRQGMHEVLSYVLLALEMDLLEQSIIMERKKWRRSSVSFGLPRKGAKSDGNIARAGVDSSGNIVVVRLLDPNYILHDTFNLFENIMTALSPAYDAIPAGDDMANSMLEEAKTELGESPMELMTSSIVSKIRFVARDEQLYGHVLYMPVPPQLYFAKWIRLMFGREVTGGMKGVMRLWDAFFDLALARTLSHAEVPITIALLDVLKAAATSMILLIRHKLLAPTMDRNGMMTGEPDPNVGIGYLMNYPPIEDIGPLVEMISNLLSKENKITKQYLVSKERKLSKQYLPSESYKMASNIEHPLQMNESEDHSHPCPRQADQSSSELKKEDLHGNSQRSDFLGKINDKLPRVCRPGDSQMTYEKHDVAESLGNIAGGLLDFGAKTASAAIASIQNQYEVHRHAAIDNPLRNGDVPSNVRDSGPADQSEDYVIRYRPSPKPSKEKTSYVMQMAIGEGEGLLEGDETPKKKTENIVQLPVDEVMGEESPEQDLVEQLIASEEKEGSRDEAASTEGLGDSFSSKLSVSKSIGESIHKKPKELASMLEKSVSTLLKHFNDRLSTKVDYVPTDGGPVSNGQSSSVIPDDIWDAMAEIDLVRKELLSQAAIASMDARSSSTSIRSSENSGTGRSGRRRGRPSWHL